MGYSYWSFLLFHVILLPVSCKALLKWLSEALVALVALLARIMLTWNLRKFLHYSVYQPPTKRRISLQHLVPNSYFTLDGKWPPSRVDGGKYLLLHSIWVFFCRSCKQAGPAKCSPGNLDNSPSNPRWFHLTNPAADARISLLSQIVAAVEPQIVHVLVGFTLAKLPDLAKPRHEYVYLLWHDARWVPDPVRNAVSSTLINGLVTGFITYLWAL